jgi:hypothetical protein
MDVHTPTMTPAASQPDFAPGPIGGPAAWRSADFTSDTDFVRMLTGAEILEIERAAEQTRSRSIGILDITRDDFPLPRLAAKVAALRDDIVAGRGFGYLRGLPVERYDRETLARIYWGLSRHLGDPVPQNRNAHMIGHVIDIGTQENDLNKRITQTAAELQFHSDACDVVGLVCLRTAETGGESMIVSGTAIHDEILRRDPELWRVLYRPYFADRRGEIPADKPGWFAIPVFNWHKDRFCGYAPLRQYVESAQRFAEVPRLEGVRKEAFDLFLRVCNEPDFFLKVPFQPGDLQYLNNYLIFHSRTSYKDRADPALKRHLLRIWLSLPDGAELPDCFRERWRTIERGTVRGGVNVPNLPSPVIPLEAETPAYD